MQARFRYPTPFILRRYRKGDQFGPITGARPSTKANLLRQQGVAGVGGEIPGLRKGGLSSGILSKKTLPLLPELHHDSNDEPSNPQGFAKTRCGANFKWVLSVDGSSNQQGSGAGVILEGPDGLLIV